MKKMVNRYKISKFKCFMNGLIFAVISIVALPLCLSGLSDYAASGSAVILPFFIAIISLLLGLVSMFRSKEIRKEKI